MRAGFGLPVEWAAPLAVGACMSTRYGGLSGGPFAGLNLGAHVGDVPADVVGNRATLADALAPARPQWLTQVHGAHVFEASAATLHRQPDADAVWTREPGVACCVLVADCLPVLLACREARAVAAVHAGWRGLSAGVLEATLGCLAVEARCEPEALVAWLGPCIGPRRFEVGEEVVQAFGGGPRFTPQGVRDGRARWLADLVGLARDRLQAAGVRSVAGGAWCTVEDPLRFFSYRRDGVTGRMAAAVWLRG
ncbi:MAG: peptidoglycan editing factor PgeF [Pseudomonadota bacterium]|jgi:YfiH family protein